MTIELNFENYLYGIFTLLFVIISLIVGIKLLVKYKKYKSNSLLFAGLTWISVITPWSAAAISFISILITKQILNDRAFFFMEYFFVPIVAIFWLALYTNLKFKKYQKKILLFFLIQGITYDIIFLYFLFTDLSVIGNKTTLFDTDTNLPFMIYIFVVLITVLITGISFGIETNKSKSADIRAKGKFILVAFSSFFIGAILDAGLVQSNTIMLVIIRVILISSAIEFYFGFFLPKWLKDRILK